MDSKNIASALNKLLRNGGQDELREAIRCVADMIRDSIEIHNDENPILLQYESLGSHLQESIVVQYTKKYGFPFPGSVPETPSAVRAVELLRYNQGDSSQSSDDQSSPTRARLSRMRLVESQNGKSQQGITSIHSLIHKQTPITHCPELQEPATANEEVNLQSGGPNRPANKTSNRPPRDQRDRKFPTSLMNWERYPYNQRISKPLLPVVFHICVHPDRTLHHIE
jgi:hypothetical protein